VLPQHSASQELVRQILQVASNSTIGVAGVATYLESFETLYEQAVEDNMQTAQECDGQESDD
ncbi:hypothetical protein SARC_10786, partial [Sphaeroforma arctica JP610]